MLRKRRQAPAAAEGSAEAHAASPAREPGRRQRRGQPAVERATLPLPLPVTPTQAECAALLKTLVKHLLFQRAQIPFLYDELLRGVRERQRALVGAEEEEDGGGEHAGAGGVLRRRRRRLPKGDRRLIKFLSKAEEAMSAIDAALATLGVPRRCFLLLGSSTCKPREAYEVIMPPAAVGSPAPAGDTAAAAEAGAAQEAAAAAATAAAQHPGPQAPAPQPAGRPRASRQERLCQLVLRQLVVAGAELPEGTADRVPCKLFLLLEGSNEGSPGTACSADQLAPAAAAGGLQGGAPPGFSIKRQFRLSMRKGVHLTLLLGQQPEAPPSPPPAAAAAAAGAEEALPGDAGSQGCSMDSSCGSQLDGEPPTVHLSQLPDAEECPGAGVAPEGHAAAGGPGMQQVGAAAAPAAAAKAAAPDKATQGSLFYLCRAVIKGLNDGTEGADQ